MFQANVRRVRRKLRNRRVYSLTALSTGAIILFLLYLSRYASTPTTVVAQFRFTITVDDPSIDWTKLAFVQHVTSPEDICKAIMLFSELKEVSSLASRVLYYPDYWKIDSKKNKESKYRHTVGQVLRYAAEEFSVILRPTSKEHFSDTGNKFLAYNLTEYERVIVLGLDTIVLNAMDELFFLPPAPLALPYVYWPTESGHGGEWHFSDQLMVIQPSSTEFANVQSTLQNITGQWSDLEVVDQLFGDMVIRLPQRPYHLLTEEFQHKYWQHEKYLGTSKERWDAEIILRETKLVHFFEPAMPKPWMASNTTIAKHVPRCVPSVARRPDCRSAMAWYGFYTSYLNRRMNICGKDFAQKYQE